MIYHTNHCWCSKSIWENENFDGEVMVSISENIDTDSIDKYRTKIKDPDFEKLTIKKEFENKEETKRLQKFFDENYPEKEKKVETIYKTTVTLKPEVIEWLNQNIKDIKGTTVDTPLNERKGWAIGNDEYNSNQHWEINIFFARQLDALKFIRQFSIFKDPTLYFDYFREDRRELAPEKIFEILNNTQEEKLNIEDYQIEEKTNVRFKNIEQYHNLDPMTFQLLDWEKEKDEEGYCDDIEMTEEEKRKAVEELMKY